MSELLDMLIPAFALSCAAAACLALLPNVPSRLRFCFALGGLAVWAVPWPWIGVPFEIPGLVALRAVHSGPIGGINSLIELGAGGGSHAGNQFGAAGYVIVALFVPGVVWFVTDCVRLRVSIRDWRRRSRCGEALRVLLPGDLRATRAQIRIVEGTRVAAVSGLINKTIWIGDRFARDEDLRLALVHECWHIRRFDPVWLILIGAIKRAYWWNPIAAHLSSQAVLTMESACDECCVRHLGKQHYVEHLASMMLHAGPCESPSLVAAASRTSLNVLRLRLLGRNARVRVRDYALAAFLSTVGASVAGYGLAEASAVRPAWSRVSIPDTPAGTALAVLLESLNGGDLERVGAYLGAYTPQEVTFDLYDWTEGLELIDIVSSARLSVEYLVQNRANETKRIGRLEVADAVPVRVTGSDLRDVTEE